MLKQTETNPLNEESLKSAAEKNRKSESPSVTNEEIEGTPFRLIGAGTKYFAVLGKYRITEDFETEDEVKVWIDFNQYRVITSMITAIVNEMAGEAQKQMTEQFNQIIEEQSKTKKQ